MSEQGNPKSIAEVLTSPLLIALLGAFATIITTVITSYLSAWGANEATKKSLEADLIKTFLTEQSDVKKTRENLRFLTDSNLIPDYADGIRKYLGQDQNAAPLVYSQYHSASICSNKPDGAACGPKGAQKCEAGLCVASP